MLLPLGLKHDIFTVLLATGPKSVGGANPPRHATHIPCIWAQRVLSTSIPRTCHLRNPAQIRSRTRSTRNSRVRCVNLFPLDALLMFPVSPRYGINITIMWPPRIQKLVNHPLFKEVDLSSLQIVISTASALSAEVARALKAVTSPKLICFNGMISTLSFWVPRVDLYALALIAVYGMSEAVSYLEQDHIHHCHLPLNSHHLCTPNHK